MKNFELKQLRGKLYFTVSGLAGILGVKPGSARVLCSRYVKSGLFIRLKNNFYVLDQNWERFSRDDFLRIANFLQVPSYVSFMTALSAYEVTTQAQRNYVESVSLKRSRRFEAGGAQFNFYKLKKEYYFDFIKKGDIFIATKEKAFIDSVYLYSFGKYKFDIDSLDPKKLDKARVEKILKIFPEKTKKIAGELCRI